jgi:EAL domain-containing protein (putative c-di-GMP-specific phosphodiesterase class I)/CheY-like chemotaxis protein
LSEKLQVQDQDIDLSPAANRLVVLYQPVVPLSEHHTMAGVEALVRYQHPDLGLLTPNKFMPVLSSEARMVELTLALIAKICIDWQEWQALGHELTVSINIDAPLLKYLPLGREMSAVMEENGMPRRNLVLEIANPVLDDFQGGRLENLNRLRMAGFRLCIDNLRTESINLLSIKQLPIDQVKIDRSVIKDVHDNADAQSNVRKIIEAATHFGADVTAVGIESQAALEWLYRNGCQSGQGYFFGPPLAPDAFRQIYLENQQCWKVRSQPGRMNLLVVEDDPQYQVLLYEALSENYNVTVAHGIADARNAFETHKPALVVLDVQLPDGSGIDLCRELNEAHGGDSFSTVFVSGKEADDIKLSAYSAGGVDFLHKPFSQWLFLCQ